MTKLLLTLLTLLLMTSCNYETKVDTDINAVLILLEVEQARAKIFVDNYFKHNPKDLLKWRGMCKGSKDEPLCNKLLMKLLVDQQTIVYLKSTYSEK